MKEHAKGLAERDEIDPRPNKDLLLPRLDENEQILLHVYGLLTDAAASNLTIAPASEWLLDNFYKIEEQIRMARLHLPMNYSKNLPHLLNGPLAGYPRVYSLATELLLHTDGRMDPERLKSVVEEYQTVSVLNLGELWAIPIMLRLALIENLRRISLRISKASYDRSLAADWVDKIIEVAETDPKSMIVVVADLASSDPPFTGAFIAEFARRLEGQSMALALPLTWIEERLSEMGKTTGQMIQQDIQQEATDKVSIGNNIESFSFIESLDWREFVEGWSAVEKALAQDPACMFSQMDFATRDRYRHAVERISRHCSLSEEDVAHNAVKLAQDSLEASGSDDRRAHVGFYLIDKGVPKLEKTVGMRRSLRASFGRTALRFPLLTYAGAIMLATALTAAYILLSQAPKSGSNEWMLVPASIFLVLCMSSPAVGLVNLLVTMLVKPHVLPRMDFSKGIPKELSTLVVVPSLLTNPERVAELLSGLEIRYLANRDKNLYFGLLD